MADSTIVTKELLETFHACGPSCSIIEEENLWGSPISQILEALEQKGVTDARDWWEGIEKTERFIRLTGSVITMNEKFKLFNPLMGQHEEFTDINIARQRMLEIATEVFHKYSPRIVTEIINENGDGTWIDTDNHLKITAIISSGS